MILSDSQILACIKQKTIVISPFDEESLGSNSYDVHLSPYLAIYKNEQLDARVHNEITHFQIPDDGFLLKPGTLYLASTIEYTETHLHVPYLEGKSSTGRLGIDIHATAGKGDVGFCNYWTMEISVCQPVRVYAGMPIGQLIYHSVEGTVMTDYSKKKSAKYALKNPLPMESMMWKNFAHPKNLQKK